MPNRTKWEQSRRRAGVSIQEMNDPHNEFGALDFNNHDAPLDSIDDIEYTREEEEALELHAERWELEQGGYL